MEEIINIGARLRQIRDEHKLTQQQLAEKAGVSIDLISKLERGARKTARLSSLVRLSSALDEDLSTLTGKRNRVDRIGDSGILQVRNAISDPALLPGFDEEDQGEPSNPEDLWRGVERAYGAYFSGEFGVLAAQLPSLLAECRVTSSALGPAAVAASYAHAYQLAACLLVHVGKDDAALIGAERGIQAAAEGDDEYRLATLYGTYVWILLRMGRYQEAELLATRTAANIEPSFSNGNPRQITAWGGLMLHAAVIAGSQGAVRAKDAKEYLARARAGATLLGRDRHDYWVSFGPSQVAMQEAHVWTTLDKPTEVLNASAQINQRDLFKISWARHSLNESKALYQRRHTDEAIAAAARAYNVSEEWFRHQGFAASVVQDLTSRKTRLPDILQKMAAAVAETRSEQS